MRKQADLVFQIVSLLTANPFVPIETNPNPTTGRVELSKQTDVAIYTGAGERVQVIPNARVISFHGYAPGVYLIQTREGQVAKVVVE